MFGAESWRHYSNYVATFNTKVCTPWLIDVLWKWLLARVSIVDGVSAKG